MTSDDARLFLSYIQRNPVNLRILQLAPRLGVGDWWLTAGALFQTVWNVLDGRDPGAGIRDYDLFYFDEDTSHEAEDAVIRRAAHLFKDLDAEVEVRNEARVHLWYEEHFGVPAEPFTSTTDAIDHFAAKTCCFAVTADDNGSLTAYAPHGYDDLFGRKVVPNPVLAPKDVYLTKTKRWSGEWPSLVVQPWPAVTD
ncbi:nucleotidyltransferase family protein [Arthrobacter sp. MMS18-M83]|uniref:nucleotidyltransferase family protein n=1 Tax=Arthrobacter sp. MMS18-M83 TaxID=2996261 RepID=UPI00227CF241|nr:nucleotidyltransferase family protein [Arthrobacter sp. MMS18-M83]WAH99215.1 nucleotidyltransferase family protein [Arthrobacter sp. MMS18-M83]